MLALAATAIGGFKVLAVDLDPRAIDAARGNLVLNPGPGHKVSLALGELSCARGPFGLVLANLVPSVHVRAHKTLWQVVAPGGWLILSGFCRPQKELILGPYVRNGAKEKECRLCQAWAGALLHKPESC
ncbi:MAG: 50S ribosomal protein L11 methyltransferase [Desulfobacterales bacterium]|nr:50S ribosomal protein L11 methyltransferase [Desulfobacterales bacterium]